MIRVAETPRMTKAGDAEDVADFGVDPAEGPVGEFEEPGGRASRPCAGWPRGGGRVSAGRRVVVGFGGGFFCGGLWPWRSCLALGFRGLGVGRPGMKLIAVNGHQYSPEVLRDALRAGKSSTAPLELLVENTDYYKTYALDYHGGERYPHLVRDESKPDLLSEIYKAQ